MILSKKGIILRSFFASLLSKRFFIYFKLSSLTTLELSVLWSTWEWDYVTDVLHTCYEENQTLEAETETCVWA